MAKASDQKVRSLQGQKSVNANIKRSNHGHEFF